MSVLSESECRAVNLSRSDTMINNMNKKKMIFTSILVIYFLFGLTHPQVSAAQ